MSDITIDGKEYKKEEMSDEQVKIFGIISNLNQRKQSYLQEAEQTEILIQHYISKFKEAVKKQYCIICATHYIPINKELKMIPYNESEWEWITKQ